MSRTDPDSAPPATPRTRLVETIRNPGLPVLAGFSVAVAIVVVLVQSGPPAPDALYVLPGDATAAAASIPEPVPGPILEGVAAYAARDLEQAAQLLAASAADGLADELRRAYLGSALARLGRAQEAIRALGPETDPRLPEPWLSEARWTRVIALRTAGRAEDAHRELEELAAGPSPIAERARRLLDEAGA